MMDEENVRTLSPDIAQFLSRQQVCLDGFEGDILGFRHEHQCKDDEHDIHEGKTREGLTKSDDGDEAQEGIADAPVGPPVGEGGAPYPEIPSLQRLDFRT